MTTIRTTCSYCSVGCNFDVTLDPEKGPILKPNKEYPVNQGLCCPKGLQLLVPFQSPERGTTPLLRTGAGDQPIEWSEAFEIFARRFKKIVAEHGPESVAFLSTGQIPFEEMALLGCVAKFGMGWIHGDGNTRQCMATAAVAYKQSFGFDAPPYSYEDLEKSDLMFFVGANPVIAHPVLWNRVRKNKEAKIVVVDPRSTETAKAAGEHLQIRPKSDLHFFYGLAKIIIDAGKADEAYIAANTSGFEEFRAHLDELDLDELSKACGISVEDMHRIAEEIVQAKAASFWWTMGVNQGHQAVRIAQSLINLSLITGHIGRPGTGPNSLTGQANAMGSRLFSNTTNLCGGYAFTEEKDRNHVAQVLGIDPARIPSVNSLPYDKIVQRVKDGKIKGLWIIATNPAHSWIDKNSFLASMEGLDFLAVQDLYPNTETAALADLYLPSAGSGEKFGTQINSERRLGVVQKVLDAPGQARSDFEIVKGVAKAWGCDEMFAEWTDPEATFRILQRLTEGQPCDISGIRGYQQLIDDGGIQWPYPKGKDIAPGPRRLFEDGKFFTPDGKAKFLYDDFAELPEELDEEFDFVLISGRGSVVQFHTQTRTGKVPFLAQRAPLTVYAELNPADADRLGVADGQKIRVRSRRGTSLVDAKVCDAVAPGQVFMPMHYPETNLLTMPVFDPYSAEPGYKYAAVAVETV